MNISETIKTVRDSFGFHPRKTHASPLVNFRGDRNTLPEVWNKLGYKCGAEIGVAQGLFSEHICKSIPDVELSCVDPWCAYPGSMRSTSVGQVKAEKRKEECAKRLEIYPKAIMRDMFSLDAVEHVGLGTLDFVYIDGNHEFDYVMTDLIEWAKRVKVGGMIAGHDYYAFTKAGVIEAVNAYTRAHNVQEWYVIRGTNPSFLWVKQHD